MTYDEFIKNIIKTRGQFGIDTNQYYELHHIIPRCLGGLPAKIHEHDIKHPNLIRLTLEEHYMAHKLLVDKYPDNYKIIYAFWKMSNRLTLDEKEYAIARELYIKARRSSHQSAAANEKRAQTMREHHLCWYTDGNNEIRASVCPEGYRPGRKAKIKEISKKYFGKSLPGSKNGMYGKHQSTESNKKRSAWSSARHWFNNDSIELFEIDCPDGFKPGRLKRNK